MAWFALAAERGEKKYVDARGAACAEVSAEEFVQANAIWRELNLAHADDVALYRAKRRWAEVRNSATVRILAAAPASYRLDSGA